MLAVTPGIVPILVDCSGDGQNAELMQQYSVQGFPTVIYTDPNGEQIKEMAGRAPAALQQDVENLIKKYPGRPSMWANSQHGGIEGAKKAKKLVALYVVDEKADLAKELARMQKDVAERKTKFVWVLALIPNLTLAAILLIGAVSVSNGTVTVGGLVAFTLGGSNEIVAVIPGRSARSALSTWISVVYVTTLSTMVSAKRTCETVPRKRRSG